MAIILVRAFILHLLSPAIFALLHLAQTTALAPPATDSAGSPGEPPPPPPRGNALSAAAALVPGLLIHGSGHFVDGQRATAGRLLAAQAVGLGGMVAGLGGLAITGASPRFVSPIILVAAAGAALFSSSALADLYGVLAPPGGTGAPPAQLPAFEAGAGPWFVRNPVLSYRWLAATELDVWAGAWRLSPRLYGTYDARTLRTEVRSSYRLRGGGDSGDSIDVTAGVVHHREGDDVVPVSTSTAELTVDGRYALHRFAPSLAGSFLEGSAGLAFGGSHYGAPIDTFEFTDLLLARFGYGFYLGSATSPRGEIVLRYDNRHDDFAGGLKLPGLGSGPVGHFGLHASVFVHQRWGLRAVAQAGSAYVLGLSLVYRRPRGAR